MALSEDDEELALPPPELDTDSDDERIAAAASAAAAAADGARGAEAAADEGGRAAAQPQQRACDGELRAMAAWLQGSDTVEAPAYHYDMMHDAPRNEAYRAAIRAAVESEEDAFVLEIGTGSGLLSLMAAEAGCQHVFTAEGDPGVARAARHVVEANGKSEQITVLPMFSTDIQVSWSAQMPCKADILVAEIFDTGLVGEGVLPSFIDAHRRLLKEGARVVPHRGRIFAAAFESKRLRAMDVLEGDAYAFLSMGLENEVRGEVRQDATGEVMTPVFQVQAADLMRRRLLTLVSEPVEVLSLEFAVPERLEVEPRSTVDLRISSEGGRVDGVLMWWELDMTPLGDVRIATSPLEEMRELSSGGTLPPVRAHWMQGASVFRLPRQRPDAVCAGQRRYAVGDTVRLVTAVRGWDIFFALAEEESAAATAAAAAAAPAPAAAAAEELPAPCPLPPEKTVPAAAGDPFAFPALPRHRLLELSDLTRLEATTREIGAAVREAGAGAGPVLCLSDGIAGAVAAVAAAAAATAGTGAAAAAAPGVVVLTRLQDTADLLRRLLAGKALVGCYSSETSSTKGSDDLERVARELLCGQAASVVVGEAFDSDLAQLGASWGLEELFLLRKRARRLALAGAVSAEARFVPAGLRVVGRPFSAPEFRRRRVPVSDVMGFDLRPFSEHAPLRRAYEVKRSTLCGWQPDWLAPRASCSAVPRFSPANPADAQNSGDEELALTLEAAADGACDGFAFWVEDYAEQDPLLLPVAGIFIPRDRPELSAGASIQARFTAGACGQSDKAASGIEPICTLAPVLQEQSA
eukprot:TRINITY_DN25748_c0_g1_i1.p1 TRINITY_DN25748_c0_g1~~TRINITY_DN25748_c0_g1_i1.p1  ORF type:complete len:807 (+),score=204.81 TRINITY_DN25748_c0_g1_i1:166-2586(+)